MADPKTFNTRLKMKIDTAENWAAKNPVLLEGEIAFATVTVAKVDEATGNIVNVPSVMYKVGDKDGTAFNSLKWGYALAADVHGWAKEEKKPVYAASEITGISDYIADYVESEMGISVDTDTQYQIVAGTDAYTYKLQSKGKGDSAWADVSTIEIPKYDDTAIAGRVEALEGLVGATAVATQIATAVSAVQNDLDAYKDSNDAAVKKVSDDLAAEILAARAAEKANSDAITGIKDGASIDSFADVEAALAGKQASGDYATKAEAKGYADAKDTAIEAAQKAGDDAQGAVDALAEKVGTVADGTTIVEMIAGAQDAATYDDSEIRGLIGDNASDISDLNGQMTTLVGDDSGKSARTIANEELAKQLIPENADAALDTLEEIAAWIQDHPDDASAMNAAITALQAKVNTGDETVTAYVTAAIDALQIGDYAKAADLTALAGRVTTLEGEVAKKANSADLADIATTGNVNDLVQTAGDYIIFNCGSATEVI